MEARLVPRPTFAIFSSSPAICIPTYRSDSMAQGDSSIKSHDVEKANVVDICGAITPQESQEHSSSPPPPLPISNDGEKQLQSSAESVEKSEAGQRYLVSLCLPLPASRYSLIYLW